MGVRVLKIRVLILLSFLTGLCIGASAGRYAYLWVARQDPKREDRVVSSVPGTDEGGLESPAVAALSGQRTQGSKPSCTAQKGTGRDAGRNPYDAGTTPSGDQQDALSRSNFARITELLRADRDLMFDLLDVLAHSDSAEDVSLAAEVLGRLIADPFTLVSPSVYDGIVDLVRNSPDANRRIAALRAFHGRGYSHLGYRSKQSIASALRNEGEEGVLNEGLLVMASWQGDFEADRAWLTRLVESHDSASVKRNASAALGNSGAAITTFLEGARRSAPGTVKQAWMYGYVAAARYEHQGSKLVDNYCEAMRLADEASLREEISVSALLTDALQDLGREILTCIEYEEDSDLKVRLETAANLILGGETRIQVLIGVLQR